MRQTTGTGRRSSEKIVKDIKRATRKQYSSEEKIRIVLDGLRGEDSIAELCRRDCRGNTSRSNYGIEVGRCEHLGRLNIRCQLVIVLRPPVETTLLYGPWRIPQRIHTFRPFVEMCVAQQLGLFL